ncbi:MAG: hypothetical protein HC834_09190 [Rhodospirillales bacterium]|nr:hypothetical protein [Rhodospirillales bacterium]
MIGGRVWNRCKAPPVIASTPLSALATIRYAAPIDAGAAINDAPIRHWHA